MKKIQHRDNDTKPVLSHINISNGGVPKYSVEESWISWEGVDGDVQGNQAVHGGKDRALCLFSLDIIDALREEGHPISPGSTGENLTLSGFDWALIQLGDQIRIGKDVHIEIMSYAEPCRLIAPWFHHDDYKRISQKVYPGWSRLYARVLVEGSIRCGDPVRMEASHAMGGG